MKMTSATAQIRLRPAATEDARMVFEWRNDPFILFRGSSQRAVTLEEHARWFAETIKGESRKMFIVVLDERPIGQVRFDRSNEMDCVISAYLLEEFTGKGYGVAAIRQGCAEIFKLWDIEKVIACVREDNGAAHSGFIKAGFREEQTGGDGCPEAHFTLSLRSFSSTS